MSHICSFITQSIITVPQDWIGDSPVSITNGYYRAKLDASEYGMGVSNYQSDPNEKDMLIHAINAWKKEVGFTAPAKKKEKEAKEVIYDENFYTRFSRKIRDGHIGYQVHKDASILSASVANAIHDLDDDISASQGHRRRNK